jgi:uncharacterized protein DUF4136
MTLTIDRRRARGAVVGIAVATMALASCAAMGANAYLRSGTSFREYRSFGWGSAASLSTGDPRLDNNQIFDERVRRQIELQLARRGLEQVTTLGLPDLLVHYHASVSQKLDVRAMDDAVTGQHDESDAARTVYEAGTLVVDLVDTRTNQLVWRGWSESRVDGVIDDQALMEHRIDAAIAAIFRRFPGGRGD